MRRIYNNKTGKQVKLNNDGNISMQVADGKYIDFGVYRQYFFTTAITANSTTTAAPAGSLARTSNSTGRGSIFVSDGSKWQFLTNA